MQNQFEYRRPGDGVPCVMCKMPVRDGDHVVSDNGSYHVACAALREANERANRKEAA